MPKGVSEINQIKDTWQKKLFEIIGAERDKKFANYPVRIGANDIKFLRFHGRIYFLVHLSAGAKDSAHLFAFDKADRNENYLKACAQEMFKDIPKMLLEFAKTIMKLNEKGGK